MDISQKCIKKGCLYKKHSQHTNNGGLYCCKTCKSLPDNKETHGRKCEKKYIVEKLIYCNPCNGFNDILVQLMGITTYAVKYNYSIILASELYTSCKYGDIFDFTNYPCKIFIDEAAATLLKDLREAGFNEHTDTSASVFNLSKTYSPELILVRRGITGKRIINKSFKPFQFFEFVKLNPSFKELVLAKLSLLPKIYYGIQIRNTDHFAKCDMNQVEEYIKSLTGKTIVLATDNKETLNTLCKTYTNIISTGSLDSILSEEYYSLHYSFNSDTKILQNAILDLIVIANAIDIRTTLDFGGRSGFSNLIKALFLHKTILAQLLI
jgi:hypothetical protein